LSAYADTSFLYSLYVQQVHSAAAAAYMANGAPLPITSLNRFELYNAIRLSVFRKLIDRRAAAADLKLISKDISTGVLTLAPCDWASVHARAERLSSERTAKAGHRAMDLLHVASALTLGASHFLTFDRNQGRLAAGSGLTVKP
jgi:predicted nucleic acid-binding protein